MQLPSAPSVEIGGAVVGRLVTFAIVWCVAAGVGIYWAASNLVGIVQSGIVRRLARASAAI